MATIATPTTSEPTDATNNMSSDAVLALFKVAPLEFSVEAALKRGKIKHVPRFHKEKMKTLIGDATRHGIEPEALEGRGARNVHGGAEPRLLVFRAC